MKYWYMQTMDKPQITMLSQRSQIQKSIYCITYIFTWKFGKDKTNQPMVTENKLVIGWCGGQNG